ncbi:hypothetical protein KDL01_30575 [Actinospica durhamensis]|uniref:Uncharacterized protein n=1 Tax=Actinospica durhamensis TaxID=1508375 RepID=A0A941ESM7_9ACTN|nr:hypothetical protein [Actinospica durhamensis]MBR7837665.1 hypothetical protein [Actinospica durhamensis]
MEEGSWEIVMLRALAAGITMGVLAGGLLAVGMAFGPPGGWPLFGVLVLAVIGGIIGALVGLACAIPTGLILAAARHFLERHLRLARVYASALGGLVLASLTVAGYGLRVSGPSADGWFIAAAFALGAAVAGLNIKFVVTGKQCLVARCLTRRAAG